MPIHACAFRPSHKWRKCAPLICAMCFHAKEKREGKGGAFFNHPRGILQPRASAVTAEHHAANNFAGTKQSFYACISNSCLNSPFIGCVDYTVGYNGNVVARAT
jgi:hypothetical protein